MTTPSKSSKTKKIQVDPESYDHAFKESKTKKIQVDLESHDHAFEEFEVKNEFKDDHAFEDEKIQVLRSGKSKVCRTVQ